MGFLRTSTSLLLLLICIFCINSVLTSAVLFSGYTYNVSEGPLNATNVTIEVWNDEGTDPSLNISYSCLSNESGNWNLIIPDSNLTAGKSVKFITRHYNGTRTDYVGANLPQFPYNDMDPNYPNEAMLNISAIKFYLKEGATINITAINSSGGAANFTYMVKDVKLGFPIESDWQNQVNKKTIYLPADRNYSIEIFPQQAMPIYYNLNNLSEYSSPKSVNIIFNTTTQPIRVTGRFNLSNGSGVDFDEFNIINYLLEPGDMVFAGMAMPYNMSSWDCDGSGCKTDVYNTTSGEYNISLQGTAMDSNVLMFAIAKAGSDYYGGFRNISPTIAGGDIDGFNFTLYKLVGPLANISLQGPMGGTKKINTSETSFAFVNSSGDVLTRATAHIEIELDYSNLNPDFPDFTWMLDVSQSNLGTFKLPLLNYTIKKLNMFTQNYAPLKKKYTAEQLNVDRVNITLTAFNPGGFDDSDIMDDLFIGMYKSSSECDVPVPPSSCALTADEGENDFKPLNAVISGGKISFRMRKDSNDITIHYKNVDMIASGPPDAAFDSSANESQTGSALDQAWRFGSQGPEIYDSILIGIPYNDSTVDETAPMNILIDKLYDHDWNVIWDLNAGNSTDDLPSDYIDFNKAWFNTSTNGMSCSTSDTTANCFVNTTTNLFWLQIPHFSGIAPTVKTTAIGGVNMTASKTRINCTTNCSFYINVTNSNFTLSGSLQNITINITNTLGNVTVEIYKYDNSDWILNGTNSTKHIDYNFTLSNASPETVHQYRINITKNGTSNSVMNLTYNISGVAGVLSLKINLGGIMPSIISISSSDITSSTATLNVATNEESVCRYSTSNLNYTNMTSAMTADSAGTAHTASLSSLSASTSYTYYASCANVVGNVMNTTTSTGFTTSAASSSSSGGGGGGGGGSSSSSAGISASKMWSVLSKGTTTMEITKTAIAITELALNMKNQVNNAEITVTKLNEKPSTTSKPTGETYQYLKIDKKSIASGDFENVKIKFRVTKSWLTSQGINSGDVALYKYTTKWIKLSTKKLSSGTDYADYEATTSGFSYFAIVGAKAGIKTAKITSETSESAEGEEAESTTDETVTEEERSKSKKPWLGWLILCSVIVIGLAAYFIFMAKRKEQKEQV